MPETASRNAAIMSAVAVAALSMTLAGIRTTRRAAAGATMCTISRSSTSSMDACPGEAAPARAVTIWIRAAGSPNMRSNAARSWRIPVSSGPAGACGDGAATRIVTVLPRPSIPGPARAGYHTRPGTHAGHSRKPEGAGTRKPPRPGQPRRAPSRPSFPCIRPPRPRPGAARRRAGAPAVSESAALAGCCRAPGRLQMSSGFWQDQRGHERTREEPFGTGCSGTGDAPVRSPVQGDLPQAADPRGHLQAGQPASR